MRGRRQAYPNLGWGSNRLEGLWIRLDGGWLVACSAWTRHAGRFLLNAYGRLARMADTSLVPWQCAAASGESICVALTIRRRSISEPLRMFS